MILFVAFSDRHGYNPVTTRDCGVHFVLCNTLLGSGLAELEASPEMKAGINNRKTSPETKAAEDRRREVVSLCS